MTTNRSATTGALVRSALLAGLAAGFIWMVIATLAGEFGDGAIVGGGFGFLVVGALGTAVISAAVSRSRVG